MIRRLAPFLAALVLLALVPATAAAGTTEFPPGYEAYHTYDEMVADITAMAAAHPDIVALSVIGHSYEGRALYAVKISDNVNTDENEPEVVFTGLTHAREHMGLEQVLALMHWLVDDYGQPGNQRTDAIVNSTEIWVLPEMNPDGAEFDISGGHFHEWRKNRQPNPGSPYIGTDLARNYPFMWGCCGGSGKNPSSMYYRGAAPMSAPEARAERDFIKSRVVDGKQQIRLLISFHSHARRILYPYGYTQDPVPPTMTLKDHQMLVALSNGMAARNGYSVMQGSHWYITSGGGGDWMYHKYRILPFTIELPPGVGAPNGYLTSDHIGPVTEHNREALLWFLEQAGCPSAAIGDPCRPASTIAPSPSPMPSSGGFVAE